MRIGLNLLPFLPGVGGTWQYAASLLAALSEHDVGNEYVAYVTRSSEELVPRDERFTVVRVPLRAASRPMRVAFENTAFPVLVARERLDCLHHFFGALPLFSMSPNVVTMYDLMAFERPGEFAFFKRAYLRAMARRAALRATILAPVSNTTAGHIQREFNVPADRMQVVSASIDEAFAPLSGARVAEFRARHALPEQFWLLVSGAYPHKNHETLIAAFGALRRGAPAGWSLVIRGELPGPVNAMIRETTPAGRVIALPPLPAAEMPALYSAASALVFPSLFEGGGQPVMEAMACGCPVVASSIPTTHEFAAGAALTFDPTKVDELRAAMARCEASSTLMAELSAAGLRAATAFRPAVAAAACAEAYRRAVATNASAR